MLKKDIKKTTSGKKSVKKEQENDTLDQHWKNTNLYSTEESNHIDDDEDIDIKREQEDDEDTYNPLESLSKKRKITEFKNDKQEDDQQDQYSIKNEQEDDDDEDEEDDQQDKNKKKKSESNRIPKGARKYIKGEIVGSDGIKNPFLKNRINKFGEMKKEAAKAAMRTEMLLQQEAGFIIPDEGQKTYELSQNEIIKHVDIQSSARVFDLNLTPNGPYTMDFTKNGRHLLLAGERGHFTILDWTRGKKVSERHLGKPIRDACFLHNETMFAVAQKKYTYIYNSDGVELHWLKDHYDPKFLQFLPYHFLLVSATNKGQLIYEDVSIGQKVANLHFNGRLSAICKNPQNAVINLGYSSGTVEMFIPKSKDPIVKVLCHKTAITSVAVNLTGDYMVTSGMDKMVKVFDLRNTYQELHAFQTHSVANSISISDTNVLAIGQGKNTLLWKNPFDTNVREPYLMHKQSSVIKKVKFCPFEDILGIGTETGYSSILVPGSGIANYDSMEADPFASKKMKKEQEVKALLEKIPSDMITLNPNIIGTIQKDVKTEEDKHKRQDKPRVDKNRVYVDPKKIEEIDKRNKERKEKRESEILNPTSVRSALSRFEKN
ncbi:hypothetical protein CYY_003440 [Polysphondylium violaceum]|uniref:BING4 C-terminal domain-containing protein n=1 Tax=Polysphondylium violaceum TaxID=133409 RepID=A0A8J4PZQ1_9MYCE|nr:hypothetical protein CYY_003440 [Polysphondylium violaceum]